MNSLEVSPERAEIDGITTLWMEAPSPFTAVLMFRAGRADETLATHGITHLVEHLALFPLGQTTYQSNGLVEDGVTVFYAHGTREQAFDFITRVATALSSLPLERLEAEKRVLLTEDASSPNPGPNTRLMALRVGARTYGLGMYQELGLRTATEAAVERWAAEHFTRENAVLWFTGPPPDALALDLPHGRRHDPVKPEPLADLRLPTQLADGSGAVALGAVGVRSTALSAGVSVAARRAHARLRLAAGLTYNAWAGYQALTPELVHFTLGGDCLDEHAIAVRDGTLAVMRELGEQGPTEDELDETRRERARAMQDPNEHRGYLDYAAREALFGAEARSPDELVAEMEALRAEDVAAAVAPHLEELIVVAPARMPTPPGFHEYGSWPQDHFIGQTYTTGRLFRRGDTIVSADEGITLIPADRGPPATIRYKDCMAVLRWSPKRLTLLALDGSWIELRTRNIPRGEVLVRSVLQQVPLERIIPMDDVVTHESLLDLAHSKLRWTDLADKELKRLPEHLLPGERVDNLARVTTTLLERGLLALTDQRLVYVSTRRVFKRDRRVRAFSFHEISEVRGEHGRAANLLQLLTIVASGETRRFWRFRPRRRALEFWEVLRERTSAAEAARDG